jgi:hypothetical protein
VFHHYWPTGRYLQCRQEAWAASTDNLGPFQQPQLEHVGVAFLFGAYSQANQTGPAHQTVRSLPARRRPNLPCGADFADARRQRMACPARMRCQCHCPSPLWFKWTDSRRCSDCATARDQSSDRSSGRYAGARQNHQQYSVAAGSAIVCPGGTAFQITLLVVSLFRRVTRLSGMQQQARGV